MEDNKISGQESLEQMIKRYQNEMMQYAKPGKPAPVSKPVMQAAPPPQVMAKPLSPPPELEVAPLAVPTMEPVPPTTPPMPPIVEPPVVKPPLPPQFPPVPSPVPEKEDGDTDTGKLVVQVTSAREAFPIYGAHVAVYRMVQGNNVLHRLAQTDINGETEEIPLPAPPMSLSEEPGHPHPFANYNIRVDQEGYYTVENRDAPVFGGTTSVQPVEMIPIPENEKTIREKLVFESEPADL